MRSLLPLLVFMMNEITQQLLYDARVQVSFRMSPSTLNSPLTLTLTSNPDSCKSLRNYAMAKPKERIR